MGCPKVKGYVLRVLWGTGNFFRKKEKEKEKSIDVVDDSSDGDDSDDGDDGHIWRCHQNDMW